MRWQDGQLSKRRDNYSNIKSIQIYATREFYPVLISNLRFLVNVVTILKITHKLSEKGC